MNSTNTIIDLLRHGEPEGGRMYRGCGTDHPLSELGWQQMHDSIAVRENDWQAVLTSPMIRSHAFATVVSEQLNVPLETIPDLREAGYGSWEGKTPAQLKAQREAEYWAFYADPIHNRPEGAESLEAFTLRISQTLEDLMTRYAGKKILLVSHAGVMRAMMALVLNMPLASQQRINITYAGMFRIIRERRGDRIALL